MSSSSPLNPPVQCDIMLNDCRYQVQAVRVICTGGVIYNEIILPPGLVLPAAKDGKMKVPNDVLLFTDGNAKRRYRLVQADKTVTFHSDLPTAQEGAEIFVWDEREWIPV